MDFKIDSVVAILVVLHSLPVPLVYFNVDERLMERKGSLFACLLWFDVLATSKVISGGGRSLLVD